MMLQCWRHSAVRRPSFIQLLDQLADDLADRFRQLSYYFNRDPDYDDAADAEDNGLVMTNSRDMSAEDIDESVPVHNSSTAQLGTEPKTSSAPEGQVSIARRNFLDDNDAPSSAFGSGDPTSVERNPRSVVAESVEKPAAANATSENVSRLSSPQSVRENGDGRQSSREAGPAAASCRSEECSSKDSSGSSQGSSNRKNWPVNGHVIPPFGSV